MSDILGTTLTGLRAFQNSLATTSHNIANVNTEGYSRQRVNLSALPAESLGTSFIGTGVGVNSIDRVLDQFQVAEVRGHLTEQSRLEVFGQLSGEIDGLIGSTQSGLSSALLGFFEGVQAAADDPSSTAARQSLLSQASALAGRFEALDDRLAEQTNTLTQRLTVSIPEVNALAEAVAGLNDAIGEASAGGGASPNDLMDQRDQVLAQLAEKLAIEVTESNDGSINVFVGSGQALVLGNDSNSLRFASGEFGSANPEIFLDTAAGSSLITGNVSGGEIGGLLDADRELISPSRNQLGQLSLALAETANSVHAQGLTLTGELGGELFTVGEPSSFIGASNTGDADVQLVIADIGQLNASDYQLQFNAGGAQLLRLDNQVDVPLSGSGTAADPYRADGLEIVISGTPDDGDTVLLRPTLGAAKNFSVAINNPADLALASPVAASTDLANRGSISVQSLQVTDGENGDLLQDVEIEFLSESTYSVNGTGSFTRNPDEPIELNGWLLELDGVPAAGDRLQVGLNAGGVGDNRNALALGQVLNEGVLNGGTLSVEDAYSVLLSDVASGTQQAAIRLEAQSTITEQSITELQSISGVNLDEEAANLLRFQQAYQAAAQMLGVADDLFQTLLGAVGR